MRGVIWAALIVGLWAAPAAADIDNTVLERDVSLGSGDAVQRGRLIRGGSPQDFAGSEDFPGTNNSTVQYHYATFATAFAPNALQDIYYLINVDDEATDLFASAYDGGYDPTNKALHWLGDAGTSGNPVFYPGIPSGDPLYFGVKVAKGGWLTLVVNDTLQGLGKSSTAHVLIQAFSDVDYNQDLLTASVPEPAGWAMMVAGFGAIGGAARYRRRRPRVAFV